MTEKLNQTSAGAWKGNLNADVAGRTIDDLFSLAYEELRRLASSIRRNDRSMTLNPTALVNEAWLKLAGSNELYLADAIHFKRLAARAMRRVLVEAARRRQSQKRGGGDANDLFVTLSDLPDTSGTVEDLLKLDDILNELEALEPRQAMLVESRFFGGLNAAQTAELLGVSEATVHRDWRVARAWLKSRLSEAV